MNDWQQSFARKMDTLREQYVRCYQEKVVEIIEPAFERLAEFLNQWHFRAVVPQARPGLHSYKFALTEDGYVLIGFRLTGIDQIDCAYECCLPGQGHIGGDSLKIALADIDAPWADTCFQTALEDFVEKFSADRQPREYAEPVMA